MFLYQKKNDLIDTTLFNICRFVGVTVMDISFLKVDFNACPVSIGNPGPSFLSGVSKCKTKTTQVSLMNENSLI